MKIQLAATAALAACFGAADAQVASALLREGDPVPALGPAFVITSINNAAVNGTFGYAATVNSSDGVTTLSSVVGSLILGPPTVLLTEATYGPLDQTSFESFFGVDNLGQSAVSPLCNNSSIGATSLDAVFVDGTLQMIEDDPITLLPGKLWRFGSRPGITWNGIPYWVGGIDDAATGVTEGNGLFLGGAPLLKTGDLIPGLPGALNATGVDFDYRFSPMGTRYVTPVGVDTGSTTNDAYVLLDGAPIATALGVIAEDQPLPAANGGLPGEKWDNFDYFSIDEAGNYLMTGDSDGTAIGLDEFVARNGKIIYRESDVLDGQTLTGTMEAAYMNAQGDIVTVWDIVDPVLGGTNTLEALYLNGKLLLKEGDLVDLDGDGLVEPNSVVADITGSMVVIGEDRRVYLTADIDTQGTTSATDDTEGLFVMLDPCGSVQTFGIGCAGSGGFVPTLQLNGCSQVAGQVTLEIGRGLGGSSAVVLLGLGQADLPIGGGCFLNLANVLPATITLPLGGALPGEGSIAAPVTIPTLPFPFTFTMQAFVIDPGAALGGVGTNGLQVTINL